MAREGGTQVGEQTAAGCWAWETARTGRLPASSRAFGGCGSVPPVLPCALPRQPQTCGAGGGHGSRRRAHGRTYAMEVASAFSSCCLTTKDLYTASRSFYPALPFSPQCQRLASTGAASISSIGEECEPFICLNAGYSEEEVVSKAKKPSSGTPSAASGARALWVRRGSLELGRSGTCPCHEGRRRTCRPRQDLRGGISSRALTLLTHIP
eukprot:766284-Hanusia_phi.AAC.2